METKTASKKKAQGEVKIEAAEPPKRARPARKPANFIALSQKSAELLDEIAARLEVPKSQALEHALAHYAAGPLYPLDDGPLTEADHQFLTSRQAPEPTGPSLSSIF